MYWIEKIAVRRANKKLLAVIELTLENLFNEVKGIQNEKKIAKIIDSYTPEKSENVLVNIFINDLQKLKNKKASDLQNSIVDLNIDWAIALAKKRCKK